MFTYLRNFSFRIFSTPALVIFFLISNSLRVDGQLIDSVVIEHHSRLEYIDIGSVLNVEWTNQITIDSIDQNELSIVTEITDFSGSTPAQYRYLNFYSPTHKIDSVATLRIIGSSVQHVQNDGFTYDSYDSLIEKRHSLFDGSSYNLSSVIRIVFDSVANTRTETYEYYDLSISSWMFGYRIVRSYDNLNQLIESFVEWGNTLTFYSDTKYSYLSNDSIDYTIFDYSVTGQVDSIKINYNLFGNKESETSYRDSLGIYNFEKITTYNYAPLNKLTDIVNYGFFWGTYYFIDSANYSYNSMGLLEEVRKTSSIGNTFNLKHFEYTPDGILDSIFSMNDNGLVSPQDGDYRDTIWYEFSTIPTGITEQESEHLSIYPNPCNNGFILNSDLINSEIESIEIYDMSGRKLFDNKYNTYDSSKFISTDKLSSGMYILSVNMKSGKRFSKQFVKQDSVE